MKIKYGDNPQIMKAKSDVFTNQEENLCPIENCILKEPDCQEIYQDSEVSMKQADDFPISLSRTDYMTNKEYSICIECSNFLQTIQKPNFKITQELPE